MFIGHSGSNRSVFYLYSSTCEWSSSNPSLCACVSIEEVYLCRALSVPCNVMSCMCWRQWHHSFQASQFDFVSQHPSISNGYPTLIPNISLDLILTKWNVFFIGSSKHIFYHNWQTSTCLVDIKSSARTAAGAALNNYHPRLGAIAFTNFLHVL